MNKRTQSQQLIQQLKIRFELKPRKCKKRNDSGIGTSQRIVCIQQDKFKYYPKIQQFNDLDFDKLQYVVAKAAVDLSQILQLKFPPRRSNERNYFTITIPNNKIIKYTKSSKKMTDETAEGEQQWTFLFDYDIISLPEYESRLETMQLVQREKMLKKRQKEEEQLLKKEEEIKRKMEQEYESLVQTQKLISEKQGEQFIKKKNQTISTSEQTVEKKLNQADEYHFHQAYLKLIKGYSSQAQLLELQLDLLEAIGKFKKRAEKTVRKFIDQLPFDTKSSIENNIIIDNLIIRTGHSKHLNLQFLDNLQTAHAFFNLRRKSETKIRIPLMAFIKYKGLKILVRAMTPCDLMNQKQKQQNFIHGNLQQNWKTHFFLADDLNIGLQSMNLKPYNSQLYFQRILIHLGTRLQIISTQVNPFQQLLRLQKKNSSELEGQKIVYAFNINQVFPIDLDFQKNIKQDDVRLRPQYVQNYREKEGSKQLTKLAGGALTYEYQDEEGARDDLNLARACQILRYNHIINFVNGLDNLKFIPMNSEHLGSILKENGINVRYISTIYKVTTLPYIRQMITIEAVARQIKKIYRDYQKDFFMEVFRNNFSDLIKQANSKNSMNSLKVIRNRQLHMKQKEKSVDNAIDFLNLVFGCSEESQKFWQIVKKKVKQNYKIHIQQHTELSHGYLLTTVLYHCDFSIKLNSNLLLFSSHSPFAIKDWIEFKCRSTSFTFPSMEVYKKCKITSDLTEQAIINRLQLGLYICRALGNDQGKYLSQLATYTRNPDIRSAQKYSVESLKYYVANASTQNFQTAYDICTFILPSSHPFFQDLYLQYAALKTSDSVILKKAAQNHAIRTLSITHSKTSSILSGFKQQKFLKHLIAAELGVETGKKIQLYHKIAQQQARLGKFSDCFQYVKRTIFFVEQKVQLNIQEQEQLFKTLVIGLEITYKLRRIRDLIKISLYFWGYLEKYRENIDQHEYIYQILFYSLKGFLQSNTKKHYMFKVVLVLNEKIAKQKQIKKEVLLRTLRMACKQSKNHENWFNQLFNKLQFAYTEINFQPDFFTNFDKHVKQLASQQFQEGLNQFTLLIKLFKKKFFEEALLDRAYTFLDGTQWQLPKKKEQKKIF